MKVTTAIRRFSMLLAVLTVMLSLAIPCFASEETAISDARNGVVRIFAYDPETGSGGTGSGFGVGTAGEETDYFVTNWHVVTSNGKFAVGTMDVYILLTNDAITEDANGLTFDTSEMIKCQVVYSADQYPDVAILKAERKVPGRVALPLRSSRDVTIASKVYSLGYPGAADTTSISYPEKLTTGYYRVRKTWADKQSQIGAYRILANAKNAADKNPGTFVFTNDGVAIYPAEEKAAEQYRIHVVKKGDTLWDIAKKYLGNGTRYPEIRELNGLKSNVIYTGWKLKIPN